MNSGADDAIVVAERLLRDPDDESARRLPSLIDAVGTRVIERPDGVQPRRIGYLATLADRLGFRDEARLLLDRFLGTDPTRHAPVDLAEIWNLRGVLAAEAGDHRTAVRCLETALDRAAGGLSFVVTANLAAAYWRAGDVRMAMLWAGRARANPPFDPDPVAAALLASTEAAASTNDRDDTVPRLRDATIAAVRWAGREDPRRLALLSDLALVELERARDTERVDDLTAAADALCQLLGASVGDTDPRPAIRLANLALSEYERIRAAGSPTQVRQGVENLRDAVHGLERALGPAHPDVLAAMSNVAAARLELARIEPAGAALTAAVDELRVVYDKVERALGLDHRRTVLALSNLASAELSLAQNDPAPVRARHAMATITSAQARSAAVFGATHPVVEQLRHEARICADLLPGPGAAQAERPQSGPLSMRVADLCAEVSRRLDGSTSAQVLDVRRRLSEPLRVAIAGRLKSGKSTLVNALIGRRVAATGVGECTRLVTQFRYGTADHVDVVRRDGTRVTLPLDESGAVPAHLGVPRRDIAYVDVVLASTNLRDLTIIDTPGLSSTTTPASASTRRFLFPAAPIDEDLDDASAHALSGAEAIVYVFTQSVRADDVAALEAFRSASARLSSHPLNSLGLLNKVDKLVGSGTDPWPTVAPLADDQAALLRRVVSDVVPAVGLLAETAQAERLTEADCDALRTLAGLPGGERSVLLASADLFTGRDCVVPRESRERLLDMLDLYGIGFALAQLVATPGMATGDLVRLLLAASGFPRLRETIDVAFRRRSDAIKASWALSSLEIIAGHAPRPQDRELLRDAIERLLQQPDYHRLRLLEVARLVHTGAVDLPDDMAHELTRLALFDDPRTIVGRPSAQPDQIREELLTAATRWRAYAVAGASPAQSRVALVAHRGFILAVQRARSSHSTPTG